MRIKLLELRIKLLKPLFFILTALFLLLSPAYAQEDDLGQSQITPASPLYFLKSIREIFELKFAGTTRVRAIRELEFATRRIREVKSLANSSRQDLIEPTLYQYLFHLGEFLGVANLKDPDFAAEVSKTVTAQMNALQAVYGRVSEQRALMSIRATVNNLAKWEKQLIDRLILSEKARLAEQVLISRLSACNFLQREASNSALNEVERSVLAERAEKCLQPKP